MTTLAIETPTIPKPALWAGRALTGAFAAFMALDMSIKLLRLPIVAQTMTQLGWPPELAFGIGVMEAVILGLYLYAPTALAGAVLMTGVLGGAVATHLRVGSPLFSHVLFGVLLGAMMWGGLYLRDPRVRAVLPLMR